MSINKSISTKNEDVINLNTSEINPQKTTGRVDINHLIVRVRKKQNDENKSNLIFFGLTAIVILTVGIILSF